MLQRTVDYASITTKECNRALAYNYNKAMCHVQQSNVSSYVDKLIFISLLTLEEMYMAFSHFLLVAYRDKMGTRNN